MGWKEQRENLGQGIRIVYVYTLYSSWIITFQILYYSSLITHRNYSTMQYEYSHDKIV